MLRLLVLRSKPADTSASKACAALARRFAPPWRTLINRRGVLMMWRPDPYDLPAIIFPDDSGALFGAVFERVAGGSRPLKLSAGRHPLLLDWLKTGGESLMRACWGPFIALLNDREHDRLIVTRDAAGGRPIFLAARRQFSAVFTHAEDWLLCEPDARADHHYISAFVAQSRIVTGATGLEGVREILPGERWISGRDQSAIDVIWRPATPALSHPSFKESAEAVRGAVFECAGAWAALGQPITHRLSGGVDSAVVLAGLVRAGPNEIVCVNERPIGFPEGDEWETAQQTARTQGVRIIAAPAWPDRVDYRQLLEAEFHAKPSLADLSYAEPSFMETLAQLSGAIVTSGQGGDQIFQRGRAPYAGADALWDGGSSSAFMRIVTDVARQARTHVWDVFAQALLLGLLRRRFDALAAQSFDTPLATEAGRARANRYRQNHSWMEDAARASPARAMRITRLIDLAFYAQPTCLAGRYVTGPVLASRPVLECVLSIPPYVMIAGGVDRSLERAAFAEFIPATLSRRTRKGDATQYHTKVLERNLPFVRELLLEGELARHELLHRDALQRALAGVWMTDGLVKANVMTCVLAETWLQRLAEARQRARVIARQCEEPTG